MRLRKFAITNYRSIRNTPRIDIGDSLTIIGPNNEGKSNLVRALVVSLRALEQLGERRPSRTRVVRARSRSTEIEYEWERDCHISIKDKKLCQSRFYLEFELDEIDKKEFVERIGSRINSYLPIEIVIGPDNQPDFEVKKQGKAQKIYRQKAVEIAKFIGERLSINHIPAIRTSEEADEVVRRLISAAMRPVSKDPDYIRALELIDSVQDPVLRRLEADLTKSLNRFLPSVNSVSLDFAANSLRRTLSAIEIQIDDGQLTYLENKGDGVISLVSMALLARLRESTGASFNTILAIEEPESHLHPRAIHAIREVLSSIGSDYQVITTTHSPLLANRIDISANVIVKKNNAEVACSVEEIRDALGVRVSDNLSHAKVVIVCEGHGDGEFLSAALSGMSEKISKAIISGELGFYSLDGAGDLSYAVSMLQQSVSVPICFLDSDKSGRSAAQAAVAGGLLEDHEITFCNCPGLDESELEDMFDVGPVRDHIMTKYKVDINLIHKSDRNRKFSDRCSKAFTNQGKDFAKSTKSKIKREISGLACAKGIEIVPEDRRGPLNALVLEAEAVL